MDNNKNIYFCHTRPAGQSRREAEILIELDALLTDFNISEYSGESAYDIKPSKTDAPRAFVVYAAENSDWILTEFLRTSHSASPIYIIVPETSREANEKGLNYGATAVLPILSLSMLNGIIRTGKTSITTKSERDTNADFLDLYGSISRHIARLQSEFTEAGLRTLPQRIIGRDTVDRFSQIEKMLAEIEIAP